MTLCPVAERVEQVLADPQEDGHPFDFPDWEALQSTVDQCSGGGECCSRCAHLDRPLAARIGLTEELL